MSARISHTNHNHPNTPAARAACRKRLNNGQSPMDASAEKALNVIISTPVAEAPKNVTPVELTFKKLAAMVYGPGSTRAILITYSTGAISTTTVVDVVDTDSNCIFGYEGDNEIVIDAEQIVSMKLV